VRLQVVKRMMCAFEGRCKVLYGPSALARRPAAAAGDKLRAV
jgi:P pilus assembly chaperone PapD